MNEFKRRLLARKRVSVWGVGYLGYTMLLRLRSAGFSVDVYDYSRERLEALRNGDYPSAEQMVSWAITEVPAFDLSNTVVAEEPGGLFRNNVHIISFPGKMDDINELEEVAEMFLANREALKGALVLFQSAETPGDIRRHFIEPLKSGGAECSFASAFRTDWSFEEFMTERTRQMVAGYDEESLVKARAFLEECGIEYAALSSIEEAELYECARKTLHYTVSSFVNQLAMAYPSTDVRNVTGFLMRHIRLDDITPSVGTMGYKEVNAMEHILEGSGNPAALTVIRDNELTNVSSIMHYAEIIKRRSSGAAILGICEKEDQKDIRMTPARILAESLVEDGLEVHIHDPYFTPQEIGELLPGAVFDPDIEGVAGIECVVLMTAHRAFRRLTQEDLDRLGVSSARLVIDNPGLWKNFSFSRDTLYHVPGDGKLGEAER